MLYINQKVKERISQSYMFTISLNAIYCKASYIKLKVNIKTKTNTISMDKQTWKRPSGHTLHLIKFRVQRLTHDTCDLIQKDLRL